jgi:hypothetical protein
MDSHSPKNATGRHCETNPHSWPDLLVLVRFCLMTFLARLAVLPRVILTGLFLVLLLLFSAGGDTLAQGGDPPPPLTVQVAEVVDQAFPEINTYLTVLNENGLPVVGLDESNFRVESAGVEIPPESVSVTSDTSQGLALVLALDLSHNRAADLDQVKAAADNLVEMLGVRDSLAILVFHDDVEEVYRGSAADTEALKQIIAEQQLQGQRTAFFEVMRIGVETLTDANTFSQSRKAVVILTNIGNNIDNVGAAEAQQLARSNQTPVHIVGFGDRAKVAELKSLARETNGQAFNLVSADDLPVTLQRLGVLLRQGYRLTFEAGVQPDSESQHPFSIAVTGPRGAQGQAEAEFSVPRGPITVELEGIRDLERGETLIVSAAVSAPAPVQIVSYNLNNQVAVPKTLAPYQFVWDSSSATPGRQTLTVEVIDKAGNFYSAPQPVEFQVTEPIEVVINTAQVYIGNTFTVEALIDERVAAVDRVELRLGSQVIDQAQTSPYQLSFGPGDPNYPTSDERDIFTVHIIDGQGQEIGQGKASVEFVSAPPAAPPPPPPAWEQVWLLLLAYIAIPLLLFLWWMVSRSQRLRPVSQHFNIRNSGNVPGSFQLSVYQIDTQRRRTLPLEFMFKAARLVEEQITQVFYSDQEAPAAAAAAGQPVIAVTQPSGAPVSQPAASPQPGSAKGAKKSATKAKAGAQASGDILNTLAALPVVGRIFRGPAQMARAGQTQAAAMGRAPAQALRPVKRLAGKMPAGSQKSVPGAAASGPPAPGGATAAQPQPQPQRGTDADRRPTQVVGIPVVTQTEETAAPSPMPVQQVRSVSEPRLQEITSPWDTSPIFETGAIEPGELFHVELQIKPTRKPFFGSHLKYRISSVATAHPEQAREADREVRIRGMFWQFNGWIAAPLLALWALFNIVILAMMIYWLYATYLVVT